MSLSRTPPTTPGHHLSDPNISIASKRDEGNEPGPIKRKREEDIHSTISDFKTEMKQMFSTIRVEQTAQMERINNTMLELKDQNDQLKKTVEFTAAKYDEFLLKMEDFEKQKREDRVYIQRLEDRVEQLERQTRFTCMEMRNIPKLPEENKQALVETVIKLGSILNSSVLRSDIKDVFRIPNSKQHQIIVEFTSVIQKEKILKAVREFNKKQDKSNKLNTEHLSINHVPKQPVFVSESLSTKNRRLHSLSRDFASAHKYKFCWTSAGKVYLRKDENSPYIRINSEQDIYNLSNHND